MLDNCVNDEGKQDRKVKGSQVVGNLGVSWEWCGNTSLRKSLGPES